ncbi:MAG: hypothetical protein SPK03_04075 [Alloprevotella sp.]|nr:hypothetical protein [Alloprevotella sp.]
MKRFTLFLALCLTMIGTALAQTLVTDLSTLSESQNVFLKTSGRGGLSLNSAKTALTSTKQAGVGNDYINGRVLFNIKTYNGGTEKYLYNVLAGKYINNSGNLTDTPTTVDAVNFVAGNADNTFVLVFNHKNDNSQNDKIINLNGSSNFSIEGWGPDGTSGSADGGNSFSIYAVDNSIVEVTFNYSIEGAPYSSYQDSYLSGKTVSVPAPMFLTPSQTSVTLTAEATQTFNIEGTENLPFVKSTVDNPLWQAIRIHKNQNKWWSANSEHTGTTFANIDTDVLPEDAYFWCFVGNLRDGFTIYNKAVGTATPLKAGDAPVFDNASEASSVWTLKPNENSDSDWFCLYMAGKNYINCDIPNTRITYWSASDAGSSLKVYTPASLVLSQDLKDAAVAPVNAVGNYAYVKDASNREALATAVQAINANNYDVAAARSLSTIATAMRATERNAFGTGYYRFYSALEGLYKNSKGVFFNGSKFVWGSIDNRTVAHILKIEETAAGEDKPYVIYTCNDAKYMQGVLGAAGDATGTNSNFKIVALDGGIQQNVVFGNGTLHAQGHSGGAGNNGEVVNWSGDANSASAWYIVPAESIEVALNEVGNASYATTYLPFAVEGDGATKLYTGSRGDGVLNMNEVSGVVPAKTALVLKGAAGAASTTLTISNEAGSAVDNNALKGTLSNIALNGNNRSNYLVLGRVLVENKGVIGFYLPSDEATSIAANKAYLNNDYAAAIALNFDDVTTGIGQVATESENAPIFDLSGRRVNSAVKGGLYIQNGKKFIVK